MSFHDGKLRSLITDFSADFIARNSSGKSLITVTNVLLSKDGRSAKILFTVLPESLEDEALHFLKRNRSELYDYAKTKMRGRYIPFFDFEVDKGEKFRISLDKALMDNKLNKDSI
ncbi:MAG: ribosome-binding factor A [Candidatus Vogelbacteria bacterium]|nr:ribosome-binding factor A [Candidatus Vogelbacteria bacterium]